MIFAEKTITLKDGRTAVLRTPEIKDAEEMLRNLIVTAGETDFLSRERDEVECRTPEEEIEWVEKKRAKDNEMCIACFVDGKAAGCCELRFRTEHRKTSHRASIGIAIQKEYWRLGIGSAFFDEMIRLAKEHPGTEILELTLIEGNTRAQALYEKKGFVLMEKRLGVEKLSSGEYQNVCYMQKKLI